MNKKISLPDQKTIVEDCIRKMQSISSTLTETYPALESGISRNRLTETENVANDFNDSLEELFVKAGLLLTTIVREEAQHG